LDIYNRNWLLDVVTSTFGIKNDICLRSRKILQFFCKRRRCLCIYIYILMLPWQINSIFIILFISLHKPSNLDITGYPALFSFFVFCPKPTLIFINLRKFTGKWCSKWCSNFVRFQPDFLCFSCLPAALKSMTFTICSAARSKLTWV